MRSSRPSLSEAARSAVMSLSVTAWSMRVGGVGHERVDDLLHVDALGLRHLGDGLAAAQLVAELGSR